MSNNTSTPAALVLSTDDAATSAAVTAIRSTIRSQGAWSRYVAAHGVTSETVKVHAAALAALVYPNAEPVQRKDGKRTAYGNAVQAAGNGMRYALKVAAGDDTDDDDETTPAAKPLLTRAGEGATLEQITAAWHAAQV